MALETDRRSPNNASSPGPDTPGSSGSSPTSAEQKRPSAFHRIDLLCSDTPHRVLVQPAPVYRPRPKEPSSERPPPQPQPPAATLAFSVDNILRPDFGKSAVLPPPHRQQPDPSPPRRRRPEEEYPDPAKIDPPIPDDATSQMWPAWVYCTRYSDRPSSGPRSRRMKRKEKSKEDKRPRTAFSGEQLARLKSEFSVNRYLTERRRQALASELGLNEAQIKIWFQNKRAKIKKASGARNPLALQLMAQGLYNHSTVPMSDEEAEEALKQGHQQDLHL